MLPHPSDLHHIARDVSADIAEAITHASPCSDQSGLMVGWPGPALLCRALGRPFPVCAGPTSGATACAPILSLCDGEVGEAWTALQLGLAGAAERVAVLDEYCVRLLRYQMTHPDPRRFPACDLLYGAVGMGLTALERGPRGRSTVEAATLALSTEAVPFRAGRAWWTAPECLPPRSRAMYPQGYLDLGAAHGLPAAIAFLGRAVRFEVASAAVLLDDAVAALRSAELPSGSGSRFPGLVVPDQDPAPGFMSWCRGDPGVALALLTAGLAACRPALVDYAVALAAEAARRGPELAPRPDACLCHGGAGLAWIFSTFHRATGEARFARAAEDWVRWTLAWRGTRGADIAGFPFRSRLGGDLDAWTPEAGLLNGASGVGLCLLAATSATSPAWEALLGGPGPELLP